MRILSIDYGDARTGFAICDPTETLASPLSIFKSRKMEEVANHTAQLVMLYSASEVVLGYPKNMNNSEGFRAEKTNLLKDRLMELMPNIKITLWDERSTTVSAIAILNETNVRGQKRKNVIDSVSAVIILENYLNFRKNKL